MNGYMSVQEAANKWGITPRQVQILCKSERIQEAVMVSHIWLIPKETIKPTETRRKKVVHYGD